MKRRNDYRLTRNGKGVNIDNDSNKIVFSFDGLCPNCQKICTQEKIERYVLGGKGKKAFQLRCSDCGFKRFDEFADRSNYKSASAKKGRLVQAFQEYLWDWVSEHIEKVIFFEMPEKINIFKGRMGSPRRHKGKPNFSSEFIHPDFVKYLDTPDYIKTLSLKFKELEASDGKLFDFILFKGWGYSIPQIDKTGHFFPHRLIKDQKPGFGKDTYKKTDYCTNLTRRATRFLIESIPQDLLSTFGEERSIEIGVEVASTGRNIKKQERVICPKCNGNNSDCELCYCRSSEKWDGTIPEWLRDSYLKKMANGEDWRRAKH